ncbi:helix-turn-helix transcriptional regulator [Acinetobacter baumannii]|uniref:helix-turn-helix domain-containing protein n=1 Tax=Acinetobacter TaxID=469 RepID=UPI0004451D4E|nr:MULTISPECIES: helix-turn-helix transcriptional regulator [Acinetobacter calcoaceticus/baumannii complex]EXE88619.1 helix-turn-helix family protein [Acinetobacter baumannii 532279]MDV7607193.1 helix-turn-helix transcriptional regulator [Acinetobacter baumannii]MDX8164868.1 helix-turn-helix transcriptional regulator [Acinetobacter pittii]
MNDLAKKIGHAIRTCRADQKITQEKLALLCNIDRSYLGRIERGEVNITVLKLYEIAYILKVEPQILLPKD